jgi:glycosyltransferase involved in cell wall biosynthesis
MRVSMSKKPEKPPFVSVIVPVLNDSKRLKVCLSALQNQKYPKSCYEVIVVDNGSDEDIRSGIDAFSQVRLTFAGRRGSYVARNMGVSLAKGPVIAFTDSDCIPAHDWIEKGVQNFSRHDNCGIVGGKVTFFFENQEKPTAVEVLDSLCFLQQKVYVEHFKFSTTANLFTLTRVFDHVGLFNDRVKSGGDREWGNRVFLSGYGIVYAEDTEVFHPARQSFTELCRKAVRVVEGVHQLERTNDLAFSPVSSGLLRQLVPPRARMLYLWGSERGRGVKKTSRILLLMLLIHYLSAVERIRLYLRDAWAGNGVK